MSAGGANAAEIRASGDNALAAGRLPEAVEYYDRVLATTPDDMAARANRAIALLQLGRSAEAARALAEIDAVQPGRPEILACLSGALLDCGLTAEAGEAAMRALALDPRQPVALSNLAISFNLRGRVPDARAAWRKALEIDPGHVPAIVGLAQSWRHDDPDRAADLFDRALALDPGNSVAYAEAISTLWNACRWRRAGTLLADLDRRLDAGMATPALFVLAFILPYVADDPERVRRVRATLGKALASSAPTFPAPPAKPAGARIVVGYLSSDFGNHAMSHVLRSFVPAHDRQAFEIVLFSLRDRSLESGPWLADLKAGASEFVDLSRVDPLAAAERIRARGVDILVDLGGYSAGSRPEILAARPAPVQAHWIGHAGFLEAPFVDYTICDRFMAPDGDPPHVEARARLPACYHPADRYPIGAVPPRAQLGLPEHGAVFCAFCNPLKIDPDCFAAWMEILRQVPESVLWLAGRRSQVPAQAALRAHAQAAGIDPARLVFAGHASDKSAHLARHLAADLFVDSFAVSAASTAIDALGAGLPVLTRRGRQPHANVAASVLHTLGLPELVAPDTETFVARAVALAADPAARADLRARLATAVATRPPFEVRQLVRYVEAAYRTMAARARANLPPADFDVPPDPVA